MRTSSFVTKRRNFVSILFIVVMLLAMRASGMDGMDTLRDAGDTVV